MADGSTIKKALANLKDVFSFFEFLRTQDKTVLKKHEEAIDAVIKACIETRKLSKQKLNLQGESLDPSYTVLSTGEVSDLWFAASRKIHPFYPKIAEEFVIKAYGWGTDEWNHPEFEKIPRKVEEILSEAIKLRQSYEPLFNPKLLLSSS